MEEEKYMTPTELTPQIRDIIKTITGCEAIMPIIVKELDPQGYAVGIEFRQYHPLWFTAELPDEEFLEYIKKELYKCKWLQVGYVKVIRNTTLKHPLNGFVACGPKVIKNGESD